MNRHESNFTMSQIFTSPLNRRKFIEYSLFTLGAGALGIDLTGCVEKPSPIETTYTGRTLLGLQKHIETNFTVGQELVVSIQNDLTGEQAAQTKLVRIPTRQGIPSEATTEATVGLYLKTPQGEAQRKITLIGNADTTDKQITMESHAAYGIYADNIDLTLQNISLSNGIPKKELAIGEEPAHLFANKSKVSVSGVTINGNYDELGQGRVLANNSVPTGGIVPRGLAGMYFADCPQVGVDHCNIFFSSWSSLTTNGSNARISNTVINGAGAYPQLADIQGIGVTTSGSVVIDTVRITDRIKSLLAFDNTSVTLNNSYINTLLQTSQGTYNSYGIYLTNTGKGILTNNIIEGIGNLVIIGENNKRLIEGNTFKSDYTDQWTDRIFFFGPPAIQVPHLYTQFKDNHIIFNSNGDLNKVYPLTSTEQQAFSRAGNTIQYTN